MTATIALSPSTRPASPHQAAARRQARQQLFWRRRLVALAVVVALVIATISTVALTTQGVQADDGTAPVTGQPVRHLVAPGESLWSIAEQLAPDADPRPLVRELERSAGTTNLQVGQVLVIPAELVG